MSIYISMYLSVCLFVCISINIHLSIYPSINSFIYKLISQKIGVFLIIWVYFSTHTRYNTKDKIFSKCKLSLKRLIII